MSSSSSWRSIVRLLPVAGRVTVVAITLNLLIGLLPLGFVIGTSVAVAGIWAAILPAAVALLLQAVLSPFQAAFTELISRRVDEACARRLMRATLTEVPFDRLEDPDVLDRMADARRGLVEYSATPGAAVAGLIALVARYAQLAGGVAITGVLLGPVAALVITAAALVARFGERGAQTRYSVLRSRTAAARRKTHYVFDTGSSPAAAKEIRVLGTLPWWRERGDREADAYLRPLWLARRRIRLAPFTGYSVVVLAGALTVLVMLRDTVGRGGLGVLGLSLGLQAILIPLRFGVYFPEADPQTQEGMRAYEAMLQIERLAGPPAAGPVPVAGGIAFEKVSFRYPGSSRLVLHELDLQFPAGTSTAIVGLNGAGKTTLVKLLSGLYEPTAGQISVDSGGLAVIFQDYARYELDAAANIGLGAPAHMGDPAALRRAIEWAGAAEVIAALPDGLATVLSSRYSGGVDLSGGQWQRIALARALFAVQAGASVLVLDEPTAQLDVRAEVAFYDRFLELTRGLTTVVISHRFSTVRRADRIVVLDGGQVSEQGSHEELMAEGGQYAELFELQARRFA
ncbi:ABC transporter ATP-binding protein [Actinoplanes sp. NPDC051343]|uniref:ABC transporter ATP-binding protein n=1 Tax=Actinoplanes sp. NPDC051343 TaxID=3363906 RepID=UPI0037B4C25E